MIDTHEALHVAGGARIIAAMGKSILLDHDDGTVEWMQYHPERGWIKLGPLSAEHASFIRPAYGDLHPIK